MHRFWTLVLAALLVFAAAGQATATAVSPRTDGPAGGDKISDRAAGEGSAVQITLITGDRVYLSQSADGRQSVTVAPAQRAHGRSPGFFKRVVNGHMFVIPADVAAYVPDLLDRSLFDVTALAHQDYDDVHADNIPVIIDFAGTRRHALTSRFAAVSTSSTLESIGAVAAQVDKDRAGRLRKAVSAARTNASVVRRGVLAGVDKIWLDRQMVALDEDSAPQIGAPVAWDSGYTGQGVTAAILDTGIDTTHPDLDDGLVVAARNFSDSGTVLDKNGHGTHVASVVAGSGAASEGLRKGIAFQADLMNVKVLGDDGTGPMSDVINGMEWAAEHDADIVNMSLGAKGVYTDGSDPASQAVDELTEEYGTLFVIAAGNDGPGDSTVTTPGTADTALTVGAVDKSDQLAGFSSRGPRAGDYALKPDLTAPGVDIIAARAAGTSRGEPVGKYYTKMSGTSMAAPHVAGAAALLMDQHPDWTWLEVKNALASTAELGDYTVYQQGGGRIDVGRAVTQGVYAVSGSLSMGYFPYPQSDVTPVNRTITYRNTTGTDVTLDLSANISTEKGVTPPPAMFSLDKDTVTVPAGGTADVEVVMDPTAGEYGLYGGWITASSGPDITVHTAIGWYKESEQYTLTVRGTDRDGRPASGISSVSVMNIDNREKFFKLGVSFGDGVATFRVPPGHYAVTGHIFSYDKPHRYLTQVSAMAEPQITVNHDTVVTLDARTALPIEVDTKREVESASFSTTFWRRDTKGASYASGFTTAMELGVFVSPTPDVTLGDFEFYSRWTLRAPDITVDVVDPVTSELDLDYVTGSSRLDGEFRLPAVYAGLGRSQDFEHLDVNGKVAVIRRGEIGVDKKIANATEAGAKLAILVNNRPGLWRVDTRDDLVPTVSMTQAAGAELVSLVKAEPVTVTVGAVRQSPYLYDLIFPEEDGVPDDLKYTVDHSNTVTLNMDYHSHVPHQSVAETRDSWRPWESASLSFLRPMKAPLHRTEYVSTGNTRWGQTFYAHSVEETPFGFPLHKPTIVHESSKRLDGGWLEQVMRPSVYPGAFSVTQSAAYRDGNALVLNIPEWRGAQGHYGWRAPVDTTSFRLIHDGRQIAHGERAAGRFPVDPEPGSYRIELDVDRSANWWTMSTSTSTAWTVHSEATSEPTALPLLDLRYQVGVDLRNAVKAGGAHRFIVTARHQPQATNVAAITDLTLWTSVDGGKHWDKARVVPKGRGHGGAQTFHVIALYPELAETSGTVSLRAQATDAAGNQIEQTVIDAFKLKASGNRSWPRAGNGPGAG